MLSQAQSQKEHGKRCKITATANEITNADDENTGNKENIETPSENTENKCDTEKTANPTEADESKEKSDDDSKAEDQNNEIKIEDDDDEAGSKGINIDPKTYCKLGHFHLLLEDYAKGKR